MPKTKNSLSDVSPSSGQLKRSYSILERSQINSLKQLPSSISYGAGRINGDVTKVFKNLNNTDRSKLEVGSSVAESLENSGISNKNSAQIISNIISGAISDRQPIHKKVSGSRNKYTNTGSRVPSSRNPLPTEEIRDARAELVGDLDSNYAGTYFPADLTEKSPAYMHLKFQIYKRPEPDGTGTVTPGEQIYLPIPDDFQQAFAVNLEEAEIETLGRALSSKTGQQLVNNIRAKAAGKNVSLFDSGDSGLTAQSVAQELAGLAGAFGLSALNTVSPNIGGLISQESGMISNPHPTVFFRGINLRQFEFSWKLIPRNELDAVTIKIILDKLKRNALPKKQGSFLKYPNIVTPKIIGDADFGSDYKKCMISSININYSGEGTSAFFKDGRPVSIALTLGLQEIELYLGDEAKG